MAKFFKLVSNELYKIFAKLSTKIFLLIILAFVILLNLFMSLNAFNNHNTDIERYDEYIKRELDYLKKSDFPQDKIMYEQLTFEKENKVKSNWDDTNWKSDVTAQVFGEKGNYIVGNQIKVPDEVEKQLNKKLEFVKNNDINGYIALMLDNSNKDESLSQEDKENNKWYYDFVKEHKIFDQENNWKYSLVRDLKATRPAYLKLKADLDKGLEVDMQQFKAVETSFLTAKYQIENDIKNIYSGFSYNSTMKKETAYWNVLSVTPSMISLITLIIVIIAGAMISNEFSTGTIKFLLINPVSRGKILMSKYLTLIILTYIFIVTFFVLNVVVSGFFFGFDQFSAVSLTVKSGEVVRSSAFVNLGIEYLAASVSTIVMGTFAFAMSTLFRNSSFAIGIGVFAAIGGPLVIEVLKTILNLDWARYLVFANLDLVNIAKGQTIFAGQTLSFALINIAIYMVVFLLTAWDAFTRRDIK